MKKLLDLKKCKNTRGKSVTPLIARNFSVIIFCIWVSIKEECEFHQATKSVHYHSLVEYYAH